MGQQAFSQHCVDGVLLALGLGVWLEKSSAQVLGVLHFDTGAARRQACAQAGRIHCQTLAAARHLAEVDGAEELAPQIDVLLLGRFEHPVELEMIFLDRLEGSREPPAAASHVRQKVVQTQVPLRLLRLKGTVRVSYRREGLLDGWREKLQIFGSRRLLLASLNQTPNVVVALAKKQVN